MPLKVEEVGDLPYGLDAGDTEAGVLLRGDRTSVRLVARMLFEEVAVVPLAEHLALRGQAARVAEDAWRAPAELPPLRRPCVLLYDTGGADCDMSEALTIGWHDGKRWYDVHEVADLPDVHLSGWMLLPAKVGA